MKNRVWFPPLSYFDQHRRSETERSSPLSHFFHRALCTLPMTTDQEGESLQPWIKWHRIGDLFLIVCGALASGASNRRHAHGRWRRTSVQGAGEENPDIAAQFSSEEQDASRSGWVRSVSTLFLFEVNHRSGSRSIQAGFDLTQTLQGRQRSMTSTSWCQYPHSISISSSSASASVPHHHWLLIRLNRCLQ